MPPIAAVREGASLPPSRFARFRTAGSLLTIGLGFAGLVSRLFGDDLEATEILLWMRHRRAMLVFIGVSLFAARLVRPLAAVLGAPAARLGGSAGTARARQRTAQSAADRLDRVRR